jgi:hypothetical protein
MGYKKSTYTPQADVSVSTEEGFIVFRSKGDLYGLNVTIEGNPETLGIPWISDQKMLLATNISSSSYSVGLATANAPTENEVILKIPIIKTPVQPVTLNLIINNEVKLIDLGLPTGISDPLSKSIEIYPNPANTILYFKNLPKDVSISIFDLQGREIITRTITNNQVDISILDHGLYTIYIENGENTIIRKLIKH